MLSWASGSFDFTAGDVTVPDELGLPTSHVLLEHARLTDEGGDGGDPNETLAC